MEDDVGAFGPENLDVYPLPEIRKRVDKALEAVGMERFKDYPPHNLSSGQKQRVAIAGIIAMELECIVLMNPQPCWIRRGGKRLWKPLHFPNKEKGITIIHITHFSRKKRSEQIVLLL